jgi:hypothetical protein
LENQERKPEILKKNILVEYILIWAIVGTGLESSALGSVLLISSVGI